MSTIPGEIAGGGRDLVLAAAEEKLGNIAYQS